MIDFKEFENLSPKTLEGLLGNSTEQLHIVRMKLVNKKKQMGTLVPLETIIKSQLKIFPIHFIVIKELLIWEPIDLSPIATLDQLTINKSGRNKHFLQCIDGFTHSMPWET